MRRLLLSALVAAACTPAESAKPPPEAAPPCPARDGPLPLLPSGAALIQGRGMATTINPGMNTSEEYYRIDGTSVREATDFYRRCLPESEPFAEPVQGGDAGPGASRSYEVLRESGATVVRVRCTRCY